MSHSDPVWVQSKVPSRWSRTGTAAGVSACSVHKHLNGQLWSTHGQKRELNPDSMISKRDRVSSKESVTVRTQTLTQSVIRGDLSEFRHVFCCYICRRSLYNAALRLLVASAAELLHTDIKKIEVRKIQKAKKVLMISDRRKSTHYCEKKPSWLTGSHHILPQTRQR